MSTLEEAAYEGILSLPGVLDAVEPQIIPVGDYMAQVARAEMMKSKKENIMLHVTFKIDNTGLDNPNPIHHYFNFPAAGDTDEQKNMKNLQLKRFFTSFNVELEDGKLNLASLDGLIGEVNVGIDPAKDGYDESNRIKKWHAPH